MGLVEGCCPIKAVEVPSRLIVDLNNNRINCPMLPFSDLTLPPILFVGIDRKTPGSELVKITPLQQRAYCYQRFQTASLIFGDEYGNLFSAIGPKGNNLSSPEALRSSLSPTGFLFRGLQDSKSMIRVIRASNLFRQQQVDTEMVVRLFEPESLPWRGRLVPIERFKARLLTKAIKERDLKDKKITVGNCTRVTLKDIPKLAQTLDVVTFFISDRSLPVAERLTDLLAASDKKSFKEILGKAFRYINLKEEIIAKRQADYQANFFDIGKDEDIARYFLNYLPNKQATDLAKVHNLGLLHGFPHLGQVPISGGFVDLDSVRGKALGIGDKTIRPTRFFDEVEHFLSRFNHFNEDRSLSFIQELEEKGFLSKTEFSTQTFRSRFIRRYFEVRNTNLSPLNIEELVEKAILGTTKGSRRRGYYKGEILELFHKLDLYYSEMIDGSELIKQYHKDEDRTVQLNYFEMERSDEEREMVRDHFNEWFQVSARTRLVKFALERTESVIKKHFPEKLEYWKTNFKEEVVGMIILLYMTYALSEVFPTRQYNSLMDEVEKVAEERVKSYDFLTIAA